LPDDPAVGDLGIHAIGIIISKLVYMLGYWGSSIIEEYLDMHLPIRSRPLPCPGYLAVGNFRLIPAGDGSNVVTNRNRVRIVRSFEEYLVVCIGIRPSPPDYLAVRDMRILIRVTIISKSKGVIFSSISKMHKTEHKKYR
jgi:hypothetical protein